MGQEDPSFDEIRNSALRLLARREHTESELRKKLAGGERAAANVQAVILHLKRANYLSDDRFTEVYVRSRMERGDGPLKIRHGLKARGVQDSIIGRYLDVADEVWETILHGVWARKFGTAPSDYKAWAKQARFLQSRGFTAEQINKVVSSTEQE